MSYCVVFVTAPKGKEPASLAKALLEKKLCACVNIIKDVDSFFWWKAKVDTAKESMLIIKTRRALLGKLISQVRRLHSYEVCEIIALPIIAGNKAYLEWVRESCRKGGRG